MNLEQLFAIISFVMRILRWTLPIAVAFFISTSASGADNAIVIGKKGANDGTNPSASTPAESPAGETGDASLSREDGSKLPTVFTLTDLIEYGKRHSPALNRLDFDLELYALQREESLFFTDPSLRIQANTYFREGSSGSVTQSGSGSADTTGLGYDLSFTKPMESGDVFTLSHSFDYTDVNSAAASIPESWAQSLSAAYTWQIMKDRGPDATLLNTKLKENALDLKSSEKADAVRSLAENVATQYYSILYLEESVRVEEETLAYYRKLLDRNVERYKVGLSLKSDVLQAENAVLTAESNLVSTRARLDDGIRSLMETIGYEGGAAISIAPLDTAGFTPTSLQEEDLWVNVIATDYSLKQLQTTEASYDLSDLYYENQLKPDVDLTAAAATQGIDDTLGGSAGSLTDSQNYSLTLVYNLPWGKRKIIGKMQENEILRGQLAVQRRQILESLKTRYESLRREIATTIKTLQLAESNVQVAEENANIMRERQHVGLATTLDVLQSERSLLQAKLSYLSAVTDHMRAEYQLKILAGLAP